MVSLVVAIALSLGGQRSPAAATAEPAVKRVCAQALRAARQRDMALLIPVLEDLVRLDERESVARSDVLRLARTWPEDFGPAFWRDLTDVVQRGVADIGDDHVWRLPGIVVAFERERGIGEMRIAAIIRDPKPRTKVMPVDAAAFDPGLARVRAQVVRAVAVRDVNLLVPILGPTVRWGLESSGTPEQFVAHWRACILELCGDLWREFHDAIRLGMAKPLATETETEAACAPYTCVKSTSEPLDVIITGRRVALRAGPSADAPCIEWLSYDLAAVVREGIDWDNSSPLRIDGFDYGWRQIAAPSGKTGWVSEKYAPFGTRLWFEKINGRWKLVAVMNDD